MPAIPMALSSAPMVVGIRQTSRATSTITDCRCPAYAANGCSVATASRKMMVRLDSRMDRAISLGVLRREAPSTRAIILSRNDSPGAAVIRTTISSDKHGGAAGDRGAVAARLADHRSRLAGDRRLVDAGHPVDDVAVAGDDLTGTRPGPGRRPGAGCSGPPTPPVAGPAAGPTVSVRAARSESACALPRPSATASARLPNSTVSHSQTAITMVNRLGCGDRQRRW